MRLTAAERSFLAEYNFDNLRKKLEKDFTCYDCVYYNQTAEECDKTPFTITPKNPICDMFIEQMSLNLDEYNT